MNAIKKRLQMLKIEKDLAIDRADVCDKQAREGIKREEKLLDDLGTLRKKLNQLQQDLASTKAQLIKSTSDLQHKDKAFVAAQSELALLNRKMQQCLVNQEKSEERRAICQAKLAQTMEKFEDAKRICKVLENRGKLDEERMDQLTNHLKVARLIAEDADTKSDEMSRKLAFVEDELETAEERVKCGEAKIHEREDELRIVGNILKSLEVSEEKANERIKRFKSQLKDLQNQLNEAEKRAIFAEKAVKTYTKELDRREERLRKEKEKYKYICTDLDSTFAELTGY